MTGIGDLQLYDRQMPTSLHLITKGSSFHSRTPDQGDIVSSHDPDACRFKR